MLNLSVPLVPKDLSGPLRVIAIGRVSTVHQNTSNIEASFASAEDFLRRVHDGPVTVKQLGEQGSGMRTDRETILEAEEEIATGTWDLVLMEDLSRAYRNPRHQYVFVQDAVDQGTRVICIGDNLDTADTNWEVMMGAASLRHGLFIPDTRRRVRRTATHSFHQGGMVLMVRFGYQKLTREEADSGEFGPKGLRIARVPEQTPVILEMHRRVMRGDHYEAVADWLNDEGISPGPYVKNGRWTGKLVKDLLSDPILSGTRRFRELIYDPVFKTGRHRRRKNPDGPEMKVYPGLAHMSPEEQEALWAVMDERKEDHNQKVGRDSTLFGRPRSRSIWPAQHVHCGICGAPLHRILNDQLKCRNAIKRQGGTCWNHVQVEAETLRQKVIPRILIELEQFSGFRESLVESAWSAFSQTLQKKERRAGDWQEQVDRLTRERKNIAAAIREGGGFQVLLDELKQVEAELKTVTAKRDQQAQQAETNLFATKADFARHLDQAILLVARESVEFTDLMREIISDFVIQPVQALDTSQVRPRVKLTLALPTGEADPGNGDGIHPVNLSVDCFEPPLHIQHVHRCREARLQYPDMPEKALARQLELHYMTLRRALAYVKLMEEAELVNPYRELHDKPDQASRWKPRR